MLKSDICLLSFINMQKFFIAFINEVNKQVNVLNFWSHLENSSQQIIIRMRMSNVNHRTFLFTFD